MTEKNAPNYLVMEYVEGADLRGPMAFDDALPIIQQLIDGIEAAHEKNIIHRDLKPANIKITPEGVVKILDFSLAKAMEPPPIRPSHAMGLSASQEHSHSTEKSSWIFNGEHADIRICHPDASEVRNEFTRDKQQAIRGIDSFSPVLHFIRKECAANLRIL